MPRTDSLALVPALPSQSQLGKSSAYVDQYAPQLLFPLPRQSKRDEIGIRADRSLPFMGADLWTAYELSWLNARGKPQVAIAQINVPCESPCIVESKSFKLYLNSFNNTVFDNSEEVRSRIAQDIGTSAWGKPAKVGVQLWLPEQFALQKIEQPQGLSIDRLDIDCAHYVPRPELLTAATHEKPVSEILTSDLLKSNCLVTNQPDWGSVQIAYSGPQIDQAGLLAYIVSFRNHNEFHEQCVERMYTDIMARCKPAKLSVYARYTRRGGLDINPFRCSHPMAMPLNVRTARQ